MMIFTACAMAFAHGSNDVANGIGPLAAVASIIKSGGEVAQTAELPLWILVMGGLGIVLGLARGVGAIDLRVIGSIVVPWVITLPVGGVLAALIFFTLKGMFT